jgi:hypothetical protein
MRGLLILLTFLVTFWLVDNWFYSGRYTNAVTKMLSDISLHMR